MHTLPNVTLTTFFFFFNSSQFQFIVNQLRLKFRLILLDIKYYMVTDFDIG
jgi:hypothetical protein